MLHDKIKEEIKEAMRAREELRLLVLRGLLSSFTNELVAQKRKPDEKLSDDDAMNVIKRAVKQRLDSIDQFTKGNRPELAEKEKSELKILEAYLPEMMSKEEIEKIAKAKKEELGVSDKSKIGILIGAIMKEIGGNADGKDVKEVVESLF